MLNKTREAFNGRQQVINRGDGSKARHIESVTDRKAQGTKRRLAASELVAETGLSRTFIGDVMGLVKAISAASPEAAQKWEQLHAPNPVRQNAWYYSNDDLKRLMAALKKFGATSYVEMLETALKGRKDSNGRLREGPSDPVFVGEDDDIWNIPKSPWQRLSDKIDSIDEMGISALRQAKAKVVGVPAAHVLRTADKLGRNTSKITGGAVRDFGDGVALGATTAAQGAGIAGRAVGGATLVAAQATARGAQTAAQATARGAHHTRKKAAEIPGVRLGRTKQERRNDRTLDVWKALNPIIEEVAAAYNTPISYNEGFAALAKAISKGKEPANSEAPAAAPNFHQTLKQVDLFRQRDGEAFAREARAAVQDFIEDKLTTALYGEQQPVAPSPAALERNLNEVRRRRGSGDVVHGRSSSHVSSSSEEAVQPVAPPQKKRGFFGRLVQAFKPREGANKLRKSPPASLSAVNVREAPTTSGSVSPTNRITTPLAFNEPSTPPVTTPSALNEPSTPRVTTPLVFNEPTTPRATTPLTGWVDSQDVDSRDVSPVSTPSPRTRGISPTHGQTELPREIRPGPAASVRRRKPVGEPSKKAARNMSVGSAAASTVSGADSATAAASTATSLASKSAAAPKAKNGLFRRKARATEAKPLEPVAPKVKVKPLEPSTWDKAVRERAAFEVGCELLFGNYQQKSDGTRAWVPFLAQVDGALRHAGAPKELNGALADLSKAPADKAQRGKVSVGTKVADLRHPDDKKAPPPGAAQIYRAAALFKRLAANILEPGDYLFGDENQVGVARGLSDEEMVRERWASLSPAKKKIIEVALAQVHENPEVTRMARDSDGMAKLVRSAPTLFPMTEAMQQRVYALTASKVQPGQTQETRDATNQEIGAVYAEQGRRIARFLTAVKNAYDIDTVEGDGPGQVDFPHPTRD